MTMVATARFWPVQRQDHQTVYDAENRMDVIHAAMWTPMQAAMVAASLNEGPNHVVIYDWTGADVWTDPDDRVPFGLCVASGGHFFGEGEDCTGCGFRPEMGR